MSTSLRPPSALSALRVLVDGRQTGELVCADGASEVHLYLQGGRIAWGTDTEHPFAFGRELMREARLSRASFAGLVERCRTHKRPLGEALVADGVATLEQVKSALRRQAATAVEGLSRCADGEWAFLERATFKTYDTGLTFSLDELLEARTSNDSHAQPAVAAPRGAGPAAKLFEEVAGCEWAEHWRDDRLKGHFSRGIPAPAAPISLRLLVQAGVDYAAVRSGGGMLFGTRLREGRGEIWMGVSADAPFGSVHAHLSGLAQEWAPERDHETAEGAPELLACAFAETAEVARDLMDRVPQVWGVLHLAGGRVSCHVARGAAASAAGDSAPLIADAVFAPDVLPVAPQGYGLRTAAILDGSTWSFGAELSPVTGESLWLVTSRQVPQGFGWACLSALTRELGMR